MSGLWQEQAACQDADPRRFFADSNTRDQLQQTAEGYCSPCPVRGECSDDADRYRDVGLWGGSYRTDPSRGYQRTALIDGAADGRLPHRHREPGQRARVDLDEVDFLTSCGFSRDHIASRLGVQVSALDRAELREAQRARTQAAVADAVAAVARAQQAAEDSEPVSWASAPTMQRALNEAFGDVA
jgi:hypothetical protein